jgi:hypothetical protein
MEVSGKKKNKQMFGNQSSIFHIDFNHAQALVITYGDVFQALAVEGDILLPKPFLGLGFDGVVM